MANPQQEGTEMAGKVVVVTGGTKGIGRAIATRFLELGAEVVICARKAPEIAVSVGAGADARDAHFVAADVREPDQAARVIDEAVARHGRLDLLVNNAGGSPPADAATASPRFSAAIIGLNLLAPLHLAQRANAVMQKQDAGGLIINIASISALRPSPGTAAYGAAKAGLVHLTQSLAIEWAPRVRVNSISAGLIQTPDTTQHYGDAAALARVAATIPLGRLGQPGDVADACVLLASSSATWISGSNLVVHGGGERPAFLGAVSS